MPKHSLKLLAFLLPAVLAGCAQPAGARVTYSYNNQKYSDPADALSAQRNDLAAQVAAVPIAAAPIAARAVVVLPDHDRLRPLVRTLVAGKGAVTGEAFNFAVEAERQILQAVSDAVVRSRLFTSVSVIERNDTLQPAVDDYDYLIVFQVKPVAAANLNGRWTSQWMLQKHGSALQLPLVSDPGVPPVKSKASFVDNLRQNTLRLSAMREGAPATVEAAGSSIAAGKVTRRVAGTGTGIVVARDGAVITNAHVVQSCAALRVLDEGEAIPASVRAQDGQNDLALLKVQHRWPAVAQFRDGAAIRQGDGVVVVGYPLNGLLAANTNLTTGSVSALAGLGNDTRLLQITAPVQTGNSGGPLLDMSSHLVGVVSAKLNALALARFTGDMPQNINFAIKSAVVRNFLEANAVAYTTAPTRQSLSAADVGDIARKFTVLIECLR